MEEILGGITYGCYVQRQVAEFRDKNDRCAPLFSILSDLSGIIPLLVTDVSNLEGPDESLKIPKIVPAISVLLLIEPSDSPS